MTQIGQTSGIIAPQSFPYFNNPRFPIEIKDLIWEFAIEAIPPRTVEIKPHPVSPLSWVSTAPIPALLHTCSRSRALVEKQYNPSFAALVLPHQTTWPRVFFNFEKDTLYLGKQLKNTVEFVELVESKEREKVKHLALGLAQQTKDGGFLVAEDEYESPDVAEVLFDTWPGLNSVGFVDQETGYLEEFRQGEEDEDEEENRDRSRNGDSRDESWAWWSKEYVVLVEGVFARGGMLEEFLLGNFEEQCEELGYEAFVTRFLEVRKVSKK